MRHALTAVVCLLVSLGTAALGASVIYQEEAALSASAGPTRLGQLAATPDADLPVGLSTRSNKQALDICLAALRSPTSLQMRYLPDQARLAIPAYCLKLATAIAQRNPTNSYAWAVSAFAALRNSDTDEFNRNLARSQLSGSTEQWVAGLRVELAFENFSELDEHALNANRSDIALLIQSIPGSHALAAYFLEMPQLREHIETVIETMPEANQRRFISVIRAAS